MTKNTTNLLGIVITILAGTYFFITYCSACGTSSNRKSRTEVLAPRVSKATTAHLAFNGAGFDTTTNDNFNLKQPSEAPSLPILRNVGNRVEGSILIMPRNVIPTPYHTEACDSTIDRQKMVTATSHIIGSPIRKAENP